MSQTKGLMFELIGKVLEYYDNTEPVQVDTEPVMNNMNKIKI